MDFVAALKAKYSYLTDTTAAGVVNRAKFFYYSNLYPSDLTADETTKPITGARAEQWILLACDDIMERTGISSAVAYRENGMSVTFDNAHLSLETIRLLTPIMGVLK